MPSAVKWVIAFAVGLGLIALGWKVPFLLRTIHVLVCFLLIVVVLLQSGKAADLAGAFGGAGSQTAFGPRGAATFLSKATTWCAVMFMLTSMVLFLRQSSARPTGSSVLETTQKPAPTAPAPHTPAPAAPASGTQPTPTAPASGGQPAPQNPPPQPPAKQ